MEEKNQIQISLEVKPSLENPLEFQETKSYTFYCLCQTLFIIYVFLCCLSILGHRLILKYQKGVKVGIDLLLLYPGIRTGVWKAIVENLPAESSLVILSFYNEGKVMFLIDVKKLEHTFLPGVICVLCRVQFLGFLERI